MKLTPQKLSVEDFKEQSSWIKQLLAPINNFIESVYGLSQNGITIEDNLFQEMRDVKFENNAANFPLRFQTKFSKFPKAVLCVYCIASDGTTSSGQPWAEWNYSNSQIEINSLTGLTPDLDYTIRFHIIYA